MVRAFYLDLTQWAADDPARWGPWVVPCPSGTPMSPRSARRDLAASHGWTSGPASACRCCPLCWLPWTASAGRPPSGYAPLRVLLPGSCLPPLARPCAGHPGPTHRRAGSGPRTPRQAAARPDPRRAPGVLDLGRSRSSPPHRRKDRGADRAFPPQLHPVPAAGHRRTDPATADRAVQDRHRAAPGDRPGTGRCTQRDHLPDPRRGQGRAAGGGLRLPRAAVESADAAAVPAPLRRRRPPDRRPRGPRAHQRRPGQHRAHRRQRQAAAFRSP